MPEVVRHTTNCASLFGEEQRVHMGKSGSKSQVVKRVPGGEFPDRWTFPSSQIRGFLLTYLGAVSEFW
jgi:hypothetical protein